MIDLIDWRKQRNQMLRTLDTAAARIVFPTASSDEVLLTAMHKSRYECTDIEPEYRHASGRWLRERGFCRMDQTPLLPEGELP